MENDARFPIGKFDRSAAPTVDSSQTAIAVIRGLPANLAAAVAGLNDEQLDTPYRDGGWTLRQTVHHVADSHLNSLCRFKLAMTEDVPVIRDYREELWAELADSRLPVAVSLNILEGIHDRWTALLESMSAADLEKKLIHPESGEWTLAEMLELYAWHSLHHTAHITRLREQRGW